LESIETSSTIKTSIDSMQSSISFQYLLFIFRSSYSSILLHILVPRKEWIVIPPILIAETPVEAVNATLSPSFLAHSI